MNGIETKRPWFLAQPLDRWATLLLLLGSALLTVGLNLEVHQRYRNLASPNERRVREVRSGQISSGGGLWNPRMFKAVTLGEWPALVDWFWIRTLIDTDVSHIQKNERAQIADELELAVGLDPAFFEIYVYGAYLLSILRDDIWSARDLLELGEKFRTQKLATFPREFLEREWRQQWQIPQLLGYLYLFEFKDIAKAAPYFEIASQLPGSPKYLASLASKVRDPDAIYDVALRLLRFMIAGAPSPEVSLELERKHRVLSLNFRLRQLNQAWAKETAPFRSLGGGGSQLRRRQLNFEDWLQRKLGGKSDGHGGTFFLNSTGKIETTTPREVILGLD
jgi:hypothetical protein